MRDKLIIIGASGHGKVVADIAMKINKWKSIAFLDDDISIKESLGLKVIGNISDSVKYKDEAYFFVAIGNNSTRERIQERLTNNGLSLVTLIHPSAIIGSDVEVGTGSVVMAGVVINSSTRIGKGCIINTSSSLDHDNIVDDYVHISPGVIVAGSVNIGRRTWLGIGSTISNNVNICENCMVGAGSVVIRNINESGTYIGVPSTRVDK